MRKILILLISCVLLFTSCKTNQLVDRSVTRTTTDSTYYTNEKYKIHTAADSLQLKSKLGRVYFIHVKDSTKPVPCVVIQPKTIKVYNKEKTAFLEARVSAFGELYAKSKQDSTNREISIRTAHHVIKVQETVIEQYKERETKFKKFITRVAWGLGLLVFIVLGLLFLWNKFRPKLI